MNKCCYSASNNIHSDLPPLMNDGRNFTSWNSSYTKINDTNKLKSNWDYRQYLTNNPDIIVRRDNSITKYLQDDGMRLISDSGSAPAFTENRSVNSTKPDVHDVSDLKLQYINKYNLMKSNETPTLTQEQLFK